MSRGWINCLPQNERPAHLAYNRPGIHDHHYNAARTDAERAFVRENPHVCYDDERCWWDGGNGSG